MAKRRSTSWAERDAVGSSRIRTRASTDNDFAISISCWSAIDRPRTGAPTSNWTSSWSKSLAAERRVALQSIVPRRPDGACPMNTFSATVRSGNRRGSWWTTAMPRARACAGPAISTGSPSRAIVPLSGWWIPARILTSVLLPAPFSPTRPWISPGTNVSDTSSRAWVAPNRFEIPRRSARRVGIVARSATPSVIVRIAWRSSSRPATARRPGCRRPVGRRCSGSRRSGRCRSHRSSRTSRTPPVPISCGRRSR